MISAGQTQDVQTSAPQPPPHVWCTPLLATDIGGPADTGDGVTDGYDCQTPPSLGAIKPLVCSNSLAEDKLAQCSNRLTDVYMINWRRTPENLRPIFEGFAEFAVNSLFGTCSTLQSTPQTIGQCMFDAFIDGNILINLWNMDSTLSEFLVTLANMLSGDICTHAPTSAEQGVLTAIPTIEEKHAYMHEHHICHDEGVVRNPFGDDPCRIANSRDLAAMMVLQSYSEKHTYMNDHSICHKEQQGLFVNPWGGSNPWQ